MNRYYKLLLFIFFCTSCQLITIGTEKDPPVIVDQNSPVGAIYLFKTELDSNNVHAASQILARPSGSLYLALERYEMYEEVARFGRIISKRSITRIKSDSLTPTNYRINLELDYHRNISFITQKINDYWYITNFEEEY